MKECIMTDKKKVSILLAVYNPDLKWLRELLSSIEKQTYSNIEVLARDDCSPDVSVDTITAVFEEYLVHTEWSLKRNIENIGSNRTFELLTMEAEGEYLAYCDQDDIWKETKIQKLVKLLEKTGSVLVCSDMEIIDEDSKKTAASITEVRKRHIFRRGTGLTEGLLQRNFVTGCAMLITNETAKMAVPFVKELYHDHWLALFSSTVGRIEYTREPLIQYRIHSNNQSGVLVGVKCKDDYYKLRIEQAYFRYKNLLKRFRHEKRISERLSKLINWTNARRNYYRHPSVRGFMHIVKGHEFGKTTVMFETVLPFMPEFIFRVVVKLTVKGIL